MASVSVYLMQSRSFKRTLRLCCDKNRRHNMNNIIFITGMAGAGKSTVGRLVARPRRDSPLDTLTEREVAVLALMAEGRSNQAIAARLFMSPKTLETHVGNMFGRLGLLPAADDHRRVLAVLTYLRR